MSFTRASTNPVNPTPDFDRVARIYRWVEYLALGSLLRRTREQFLPQLTATRKALLLGDGDGRFAAALLRCAPTCHLRAVDSSAAMLELLQKRCARDGASRRVTVTQASVLDLPWEPGYDLVATHFLLDCLTEPQIDTLARRFAAEVQPPFRWVISEFGRPRGRVAGLLGAGYVRLLYLCFRVLTNLRVRRLPNPQDALQKAGFVRLGRVERLGGLLYSELWTIG